MVGINGNYGYSMPFGTAGALDRVTPEQLKSPGMYTYDPISIPGYEPQEQKKHGGLASAIGKLVITAAVVTGAAVGLRKGVFKYENVKPEKFEGIGQKVKYYFAEYSDKVYNKCAEWIGKIAKKPPKTETPNPSAGGVDTQA